MRLEIKHHLNLDCSFRTVRRRLDEAGLFGRLAAPEPNFTNEQLKMRVNFGSVVTFPAHSSAQLRGSKIFTGV